MAQRAASIDESNTFVGENYALLKESGLVRAGVPIELGGLGAEVPELSEMLKSISRACGSTAATF
ncbi:acyl-CoA dehydrogenase family protein [Rhizobium leguminosarum]|uniref:acyl-CoA dehydrogenase family protein n=1 Tax=Rhizobium leguminosarum TaxID=384 RepID=UPI003F99ABE7